MSRFREIYESYAPLVAAFFKRRGAETSVCLELTQDVFLRVHRGLPEFQEDAEDGTWVWRIATNVWLNHRRSFGAQKRAGTEVSFQDLEVAERLSFERQPSLSSSEGRGSLEGLLQKERFSRLDDATRRLPALEQRLLYYQIDQELTMTEIAGLEGIPVGTVKSRLSTARNRLREILSKDFPEIRKGEAR